MRFGYADGYQVRAQDNAATGSGKGATCVITARLSPAGRVRVRSTGPHPAAVIDRATERVARAIATELSGRPLA